MNAVSQSHVIIIQMVVMVSEKIPATLKEMQIEGREGLKKTRKKILGSWLC